MRVERRLRHLERVAQHLRLAVGGEGEGRGEGGGDAAHGADYFTPCPAMNSRSARAV